MACASLLGCFFTTILIVLPATLNPSFFNICSTDSLLPSKCSMALKEISQFLHNAENVSQIYD